MDKQIIKFSGERKPFPTEAVHNIDYLIQKININGNFIWSQLYGNDDRIYLGIPTDDIPVTIRVDNNKEVFVSGYSPAIEGNTIGNNDIATLKITQGDSEFSDEIKRDLTNKKFTLEQNYPNPFNPVTRITFVLPSESFTRLSIYDVQGREIQILVNGILKEGIHNYIFDASRFSSGIYFYTLHSGPYVDTRKMLFIK